MSKVKFIDAIVIDIITIRNYRIVRVSTVETSKSYDIKCRVTMSTHYRIGEKVLLRVEGSTVSVVFAYETYYKKLDKYR